MKVEQISVFLENKPGALAEVTRILGESGVNIRALSLADTKDFGILRLIVNDNEKAMEILGRKGLTVRKTEVVAVEVPDRPGGLAEILKILFEADINVEYLYAFVQQSGENAIIIFRFDETDGPSRFSQKNRSRFWRAKKYTPCKIKRSPVGRRDTVLIVGRHDEKRSNGYENPSCWAPGSWVLLPQRFRGGKIPIPGWSHL